MNGKLVLKIIIDVSMTICLLLLMPYSLLGEVVHEWIGIAMFVLFIVHHILNRKWITAMAKGKYTVIRATQTVLVIVLLILMLGSMVSGILLSENIFKAVRIHGIAMQARQVHMFCAYWGFVCISLHLGIHWNMIVVMVGRLFDKPSRIRSVFAKVLAVLAAGYGVYAFYRRQILSYLFMQVHFVFYDYKENVIWFIFDYVMAMSLIVFIGYYASKLLRSKKAEKRGV